MNRLTGLAAAVLVLVGVAAAGAGTLDLNLSLLPSLGLAGELHLGTNLLSFALSSVSVVHFGAWSWQEFSAQGSGPFGNWEAHLLFGPSTADFLYDELIFGTELFGLKASFYAAQLSGAVLGGPASGAALKLSAAWGEAKLESTTELGASPTGIEIYHAATGVFRSYLTDPRPAGNGLTGELLSLSGLRLPCGGSDCPVGGAELYFTKENGFEYLKLSAAGWKAPCCPAVGLDFAATFRLQTKSISVYPTIHLGGACLTPYIDLVHQQGTVPAIDVGALEFRCELGKARIHSLTIFNRCCYAIATPDWDSQLVSLCPDRSPAGADFYPQYWELLSLEMRGAACCGGEWKALFNAYFGDEPGLFGWSRSYFQLAVPLAESITASGRLALDRSGVEELALRLSWRW